MSSATPSPPSLGFLLKRAQHAFRTRLDDSLRSLGLTAPQFAVLAAVDRDAGISNAELARLAFVTAQSMQGILANLERGGLLARTPHPQHGRILRSVLTEDGRVVFEQARLRVAEIEGILAQAIGPDDAPHFAEMLSSCADRLSARAVRPKPAGLR